MQDFIDCDSLHRLYKPIESNGKYVFQYIFNLQTSNFMTLRNGKVQEKKFKSF